ncbi:hypothetical protein [Sphingomonas phyllosphaerae]|uniref:hypothetical protein n=1 Tax=Sphingomonas phyllosphaerae TaxID=257003 RepID=UPI003D6B47E2
MALRRVRVGAMRQLYCVAGSPPRPSADLAAHGGRVALHQREVTADEVSKPLWALTSGLGVRIHRGAAIRLHARGGATETPHVTADARRAQWSRAMEGRPEAEAAQDRSAAAMSAGTNPRHADPCGRMSPVDATLRRAGFCKPDATQWWRAART